MAENSRTESKTAWVWSLHLATFLKNLTPGIAASIEPPGVHKVNSVGIINYLTNKRYPCGFKVKSLIRKGGSGATS